MSSTVGVTTQNSSDAVNALNAVPLHVSSLVNWQNADSQEKKYVVQYINGVYKKLGFDPEAVSLFTDYPCKGILLVVPQVYSKGRRVQCDEGYLELNLKERTFRMMHGNYTKYLDEIEKREKDAEKELEAMNSSSM